MNKRMTSGYKTKVLKDNRSRLRIVFFWAAVLLSTTLLIFFPPNLQKYSLVVVKTDENFPNRTIAFHDFDSDGYSERVQLLIDSQHSRNVVSILSFEEAFIDQFPFDHPFCPGVENVYFGDVNNDNVDECIIFSKTGDTLFLSILNINPPEWVVKEKPVLTAPEGNPYHDWDIKVNACRIFDSNNDGMGEVLFSVHTGYALHPRGVYLFDIQRDDIVHKFEADAAFFDNVFLQDIDADGKEEIIVGTGATGNNRNATHYTDFKCWLFILDQQLRTKIPPISFGEYPSGIFCLPVEENGQPMLFMQYRYGGNKNLPGFLYLVNARGKVVGKRSIFLNKLPVNPLLLKTKDAYTIFVSLNDGGIEKINPGSDILSRWDGDSQYPNYLMLDNILGNGQKQLLVGTGSGLYLLSDNLDELVHSTPMPMIQKVGLQHRGMNNPAAIYVFTEKKFYVYHLKKNLLSLFTPIVLLPLLTAGFYIALLATFFVSNRGFIILRYFKVSIKEASAGVLVLDDRWKIIYMNSWARHLLGLEDSQGRKQFLKREQETQSEFEKKIRTALELREDTELAVAFHDGKTYFNGHIVIKPFYSFPGFCHGYLVEIWDHSQEIISDRLRVWSRTIERIAHDLKTPLASIILNLDTVRLHLNKTDFPEKANIEEDLDRIQRELEWIKNRTKLFQIFANLDEPVFEAVRLPKIIAEACLPFQSYQKSGLTMRTFIDPESELLYADPRLLLLLFHIVLENAIDATKGAGIIDVRSSVAQDMQKENRFFAEIEIADNGSGIPEELLSKVFEPNVSSKGGDRGMGLTFARKIVSDHGGQIYIYTNKPRGTVVSFTLPLFHYNEMNDTSGKS